MILAKAKEGLYGAGDTSPHMPDSYLHGEKVAYKESRLGLWPWRDAGSKEIERTLHVRSPIGLCLVQAGAASRREGAVFTGISVVLRAQQCHRSAHGTKYNTDALCQHSTVRKVCKRENQKTAAQTGKQCPV